MFFKKVQFDSQERKVTNIASYFYVKLEKIRRNHKKSNGFSE